MDDRLIRQPSALLPIGMSLAAIAMIVVHVARFGVTREADEGTAAHVFQLLMVAQLPVMAYFTLRWLPRRPGPTLGVLGLQVALALIAVGLVAWLESTV